MTEDYTCQGKFQSAHVIILPKQIDCFAFYEPPRLYRIRPLLLRYTIIISQKVFFRRPVNLGPSSARFAVTTLRGLGVGKSSFEDHITTETKCLMEEA